MLAPRQPRTLRLERRAEEERMPVELERARLAGGILSGGFGGLVGNQGGIRAAALLGFRLPPRALVATATASALFVDAARVPIYLVTSGPVLASTAPLWLAASAGAVIGTFIGVPMLGRIPEPVYRQLIGALLVVLGITLLAAAI